MTVKSMKKRTRKPKLDAKKGLVALAMGETKVRAAEIAGSEARTPSGKISSLDKAIRLQLTKEETQGIASRMMRNASALFEKVNNISNNYLDSEVSDKEKLQVISPLSVAKVVESAHKIHRLENDQSTENIAHKYDNMSPQELAQLMEDMISQYK